MRTRTELLKTLYNNLSIGSPNILAADEIDSASSEGVMDEEKRALPAFFKPGGTYDLLLDKHPQFANAATAKEAENKAFNGIIDAIVKRLAKAKDRLSGGNTVGMEKALKAVQSAKHRQRREFPSETKTKREFDDIGRCHSALRLLLNDDTQHPHSHWQTEYFNPQTTFEYDHRTGKNSYLRLLTLIFRGLTENDIDAPITANGLSKEQLIEAGIEQLISALAQCRREHNFDGSLPDYNQSRKPSDAQRCDMGFRGDLFGQLLIYNERYMQTRSKLDVALIENLIKEEIFLSFQALEQQQKNNIIKYIGDKFILQIDPEENSAGAQAIQKFISRITKRGVIYDAVINRIQQANPGDTLFNISQHLTNLMQKAQNGDPTAIQASSTLIATIDQFIQLEANSLLGTGSAYATMDYLSKFGHDTLLQLHKKNLQTSFTNHADKREYTATQHGIVVKGLAALKYCIGNDLMRQQTFPSCQLTQERIRIYQRIIMQYELRISNIESVIKYVIENSAQGGHDKTQALAGEFAFMNDPMVKSSIAHAGTEFVQHHQREVKQQQDVTSLQSLKASLAQLKTELEAENNPDMFSTPVHIAKQLWDLLMKKTSSNNYFISSYEDDDPDQALSDFFDYLCGNPSRGILGVTEMDRNIVIYAFNAEYKRRQEEGPRYSNIQIRRTDIYQTVLNHLLIYTDIPIDAICYKPSTLYVNLIEECYKAATIPAEMLKKTFQASGKVAILEDAIINEYRDESLAAIKESHFYYQRMIRAAASLDIRAPNTNEEKAGQPSENLATWSALAESIFIHSGNTEHHKVEALTNFVVLTVMHNLTTIKFSFADRAVLERIVKVYMGAQEYNTSCFPLSFYLPIDNRQENTAASISQLAQHLSVMLRTLYTVRVGFTEGQVRLLSRSSAFQIVVEHQPSRILRVSNSEPNELAVSYAKSDNDIGVIYLEQKQYSGTNLTNATSHIPDDIRNNCPPIIPDMSLEKISDIDSQNRHDSNYNAFSSRKAKKYDPYGAFSLTNHKDFFHKGKSYGEREAVMQLREILSGSEVSNFWLISEEEEIIIAQAEQKNQLEAPANLGHAPDTSMPSATTTVYCSHEDDDDEGGEDKNPNSESRALLDITAFLHEEKDTTQRPSCRTGQAQVAVIDLQPTPSNQAPATINLITLQMTISNTIKQRIINHNYDFGGIVPLRERWRSKIKPHSDDNNTTIVVYRGIARIWSLLFHCRSPLRFIEAEKVARKRSGWRGLSILSLGASSRSKSAKQLYKEIADDLKPLTQPSA